MSRWLLLAALAAAGIGAMMLLRRMRTPAYEAEAIDAAGQGTTFGERSGTAPEQLWSPAETRTDVTAEQLSMEARLEFSLDAIRNVWPAIDREDVERAEGDIDRLARMIAEKVEQPVEQVRQRLDDILAQETSRPSYPPH